VATGRARRWATADVLEPVELGRAGIQVVLWDKWGRKRVGTAIISVGGIRWFPYKYKIPYRIGWDRLTELLEDNG